MPAAKPKQPTVGPFTGNVKPLHDRPGLYLRMSPKGERVWSWWDGSFWYMFSNTKERALKHMKNRKTSKYQSLLWFGMARFQSA